MHDLKLSDYAFANGLAARILHERGRSMGMVHEMLSHSYTLAEIHDLSMSYRKIFYPGEALKP